MREKVYFSTRERILKPNVPGIISILVLLAPIQIVRRLPALPWNHQLSSTFLVFFPSDHSHTVTVSLARRSCQQLGLICSNCSWLVIASDNVLWRSSFLSFSLHFYVPHCLAHHHHHRAHFIIFLGLFGWTEGGNAWPMPWMVAQICLEAKQLLV